MATYIVKHDQAVWERMTVRIEVPDNIPADDVGGFIDAQMDAGNYEDLGTEVLCEVSGVDSETEFELETDI